MPEMPEIQAHAERLESVVGGRRLERFQALTFTALKTAVPAPESSYGHELVAIRRRGKYLLLDFGPTTFVIHLMQGGRLLVDTKLAAKPRGGQARLTFDEGPALLLTEQGTERRAGVWCVETDRLAEAPPLADLGPEAAGITADQLRSSMEAHSMRIHGFLRDQHVIAGLGRRLANEICHRARISPFAQTKKMSGADAETLTRAIRECIDESLAEERARDSMSASKERTSSVHHRTGEACRVCGDTVRAVEYSGYTVNYCPACQTGGKILADNTTSKFLR